MTAAAMGEKINPVSFLIRLAFTNPAFLPDRSKVFMTSALPSFRAPGAALRFRLSSAAFWVCRTEERPLNLLENLLSRPIIIAAVGFTPVR